METLYTARATTHGGRDGHVESSDGVVDLDLTTPSEMGGPEEGGTNPEQLFAAGYSACFESALRLIARRQKKDIGDASITAAVDLGKTDDGGFGIAVELTGTLPNVPREEAQELMEAAHEVCPYSRATRGNVDVTLSVAG